MTGRSLALNGATLVADVSGALYWPNAETVVVADLHLEKGSRFAQFGNLLPPYDSRATLTTLAGVLARFRPRRVICLGDSFHDADAPDRLSKADVGRLMTMTAAHDWVWVAGNHDPAPPGGLGGRVVSWFEDGPLKFRHEAHHDGDVNGEVSGHFHPRAAVTVRGRRLANRCFVGDRSRVILPAFGAYAGGLDVSAPAIADLFVDGFTAYILGRRGVYAFAGDAITAGRS